MTRETHYANFCINYIFNVVLNLILILFSIGVKQLLFNPDESLIFEVKFDDVSSKTKQMSPQ